MENLEIRVRSDIKKIKVNDQGDFIEINITDGNIMSKFVDLYKNLEGSSNEFREKAASLTGMNEMEDVVTFANASVTYLNICIDELEKVFGEGAILKVFRDDYERDENFLPSEDLLIEFVEQVVPIMENLFNQRVTKLSTKYNPNFKGKNTNQLTRQQMIQDFKNRSGVNE